MKALIVNADDFGLSASVNRGIVEAHRDGIVSSTTLLANMPGFEDAVARARACPELGVGVHLNVLRGRPVSDPASVASLLNGDGGFLASAAALVLRALTGRIEAAELLLEFQAQIQKVADAGVDITHVDSEKHLHALPTFFRAAARSAVAAGIEAIRFPAETRLLLRGLPAGTATPLGRLKSRIIHTLAGLNHRRLERSELTTTDHFFGIAAQERLGPETLVALARALPPGTCELSCHPGYVDAELLALSAQVGGYWVNRVRERELTALTDPLVARELVENRVKLITFRSVVTAGDGR